MATSSPVKKRPKLSLKFSRKEKSAPTPAAIEDDEQPADVYDGQQHDGHGFDSDHCADDAEAMECQEMPAPYCGLYNLGNTCYFNSVLQALRYTPGFCDGLKRLADVVFSTEKEEGDEGPGSHGDAKPTKMTNSGGAGVNKSKQKLLQLVVKLNQLFDMMMAKEDHFHCEPSADQDMGVYPEAVLASVRELNPMFQGYLQHDSQELLCCLLSQLQDASHTLLQVVKEEKQKRYRHSKLSLAGAKSGIVSESNVRDKTSMKHHHVSNGVKANTKGQSSSQVQVSKTLCNGSTNNGVTSNGAVGNGEKGMIPRQASGEGGKTRKRTSSVRDSDDAEGSNDDQTPQRKVKRRSGGSVKPSSGTVLKSKTEKSKEQCVNGNNNDGKTPTSIVNGNGTHLENGKSAKGSKVNSGKKKRLGIGRMRVPFNQPTILSKFGFTKENGSPKNGLSKEVVSNGIVVNGSGDHGMVNGKDVSPGKTSFNTSDTNSQPDNTVVNGTCNQSNNNSNQTLSHVPNSPKKTSKILDDSKSQEATDHHPHNNNNIVTKSADDDEKKSGCLETKSELDDDDESDVECLETVSSFEKYLQVVEKMFQGSLVLRTRCMECEGFTERREDFQDISVPVQKMNIKTEAGEYEEENIPEVRPNNLSLSWSLSEFACAEKLTAENKYFCESCRHHNEAERTMLFGSLPPVLSIQLKRFCAFSGSLAFGGVSKVNDHLATPLSLCLNQWCTKQCRQREQKYALYAVVMHSGVSSSSGHYVCYVKIPSREGAIEEDIDEDDTMADEVWGHFDDERATVLSNHEFGKILHPVNGSVTTATPYLLFYRKVETR